MFASVFLRKIGEGAKKEEIDKIKKKIIINRFKRRG